MISLILSLCGTNMNHYINLLFILQAKADGRLIERATLYSILHTRKDGSTVNEVVKEKMVSNPFHIQGIVVSLKNGELLLFKRVKI